MANWWYVHSISSNINKWGSHIEDDAPYTFDADTFAQPRSFSLSLLQPAISASDGKGEPVSVYCSSFSVYDSRQISSYAGTKIFQSIMWLPPQRLSVFKTNDVLFGSQDLSSPLLLLFFLLGGPSNWGGGLSAMPVIIFCSSPFSFLIFFHSILNGFLLLKPKRPSSPFASPMKGIFPPSYRPHTPPAFVLVFERIAILRFGQAQSYARA